MKSTYDILKRLMPNVYFQTRSSIIGEQLATPLPPKQITGKLAEPFDTVGNNYLSVRVDGSDTIPIELTEGVLLAAAVVSEINAITLPLVGNIATDVNGVVILRSPTQDRIEIMEGNTALGLYEERDAHAFLKVMSPTIDTLRDTVDRFFDRTMDLDLGDDEFIKEIAALLGHTWDDSEDFETQRRIVKELPFFYRYKGTIPAIERIVRLKGGKVSVFQPYPYIMKYELSALDGERIYDPSGSRSMVGGEIAIATPTTFLDTTNSPFTAEDEGRYIYIPSLPGPINGYRISQVVSSSEVTLPSAAFDQDLSDIFYTILDPPRIQDRLESRDFWHQGIYEVCADIPPSEYRDDLLELTHPAGRVVFFCFVSQPEIVDASVQQIYTNLILDIQLLIRYNEQCGHFIDVGPPIETVVPGGGYDGCQVIFGTYCTLAINSITHARRTPVVWSQLMYWLEMSGGVTSYVELYEYGEEFNQIVSLPEGHLWITPVVDVQPDVHITFLAFSEDITRGAGASDALPSSIPIGSRIIYVNQGGTPDKVNDMFSGGTDYTETTDWEQTGGSIDWVGAAPATSTQYRVFYEFDAWDPFGVPSGSVPISLDGIELKDSSGNPITSW